MSHKEAMILIGFALVYYLIGLAYICSNLYKHRGKSPIGDFIVSQHKVLYFAVMPFLWPHILFEELTRG